jgi:light-regulated signal transduction histidine kinase (bacteriophytochrome)
LNADGSVRMWVGTNTDIHDHKMVEKSLVQANKELEQFAYVTSHDLKAPLRAIGHLADWLTEDLQGSLSEQGKKYMQMLHGRLRHMNALIDGILQYSRVGRANVKKERLNPLKIIQESWEVLDHKRFRLVLPVQMPEVNANPVVLGQVFSNLLSNAIKHHTNNPVEGVVDVGCNESDGECEFFVKDDGPGIDPLFYGKIFGMFQTPKPKDDTDNTGVGLALCKRIVEQNGGQIRFESELGKGTTFFFTWKKA